MDCLFLHLPLYLFKCRHGYPRCFSWPHAREEQGYWRQLDVTAGSCTALMAATPNVVARVRQASGFEPRGKRVGRWGHVLLLSPRALYCGG